MTVNDLPAVNAILNGTSAALLVAAYIAIKRRRFAQHGYLICGAVMTSAAFLACYLTYHFHVPTKSARSLYPAVPDWLYHVYLWVILLPHTLLAVIMLPFIGFSLFLAYRRRWEKHQRLSPWSFWMWLYVSITGVMIYALLYYLFPAIQQSALAGVES